MLWLVYQVCLLRLASVWDPTVDIIFWSKYRMLVDHSKFFLHYLIFNVTYFIILYKIFSFYKFPFKKFLIFCCWMLFVSFISFLLFPFCHHSLFQKLSLFVLLQNIVYGMTNSQILNFWLHFSEILMLINCAVEKLIMN